MATAVACAAAIAAPLNAAADGTTAAGLVTGLATIDPPIPTGVQCALVGFTFSGTSQAAAITIGPATYLGAIGISASGSGCDSAPSGSGSVSADVVSYVSLVSDANLTCSTLTGGYIRVATHIDMVVQGDCTYSGVSTGTMNWIISGQVIPSSPDQGVTSPISSASFAGALLAAQ